MMCHLCLGCIFFLWEVWCYSNSLFFVSDFLLFASELWIFLSLCLKCINFYRLYLSIDCCRSIILGSWLAYQCGNQASFTSKKVSEISEFLSNPFYFFISFFSPHGCFPVLFQCILLHFYFNLFYFVHLVV